MSELAVAELKNEKMFLFMNSKFPVTDNWERKLGGHLYAICHLNVL